VAARPLIDELVDEAVGRRVREDPVRPGTGGPAGNARLTAWTGVLLLALVLAELITLLDVRGLISWHVGLGAALIPVAALKTATTSWRIVRYYTGQRDYRTAGPPPAVLRALGPLVVLGTLGVLASGVLLIALGDRRSRATLFTALGQRVDLVTVHQALFIVFAVTAGLHLLARAVRVVELVAGHRAAGGPGRVPGRGRRGAGLVLVLASAVLAVVLLLPLAAGWHDDRDRFDRPPMGGPVEDR
jgi:hypothetical protein